MKTDQESKALIIERAKQYVIRKRKSEDIKPLSFSSLDADYYHKFHEIYEQEKNKDALNNKKFSKIDLFKRMIDLYEQHNSSR